MVLPKDRWYYGCMTKRERTAAVLRREQTDLLPVQVSYTGAMARKLCSHFKIAAAELPDFFGNHLLRVDIGYEKKRSPAGDIEYDWWGAGFDAGEEGYFVRECPLASLDDIGRYPWPDPGAPGLLDAASAVLKAERAAADARFIMPNFGFALFERAWSLRGLENFMMDLLTEEEKAEALLEKITEIQIALAERFLGLGINGGYFGDDLGAQKGTLFSPELFRRLFKPRYRRMFAVFRDAGLPVIMHSDGDIKDILPDLIDIGLDCLNPCQPEVLNHAWLKKEYGSDLSFFGGLSTQEVLPRGSRDDVLQAGRDCIRDLASGGTGLIYGPSHRIMSDIPMENIEAFLESCASR